MRSPDPHACAESHGGIYKTIDGGKTWNKLEGGLPATRIGRIGLALFLKSPNILYAIVDNQGRPPLTEAEKTRNAGRRDAESRPRRAGILVERNFGDFRTLWIDLRNSQRWLIGSDGGGFAGYRTAGTHPIAWFASPEPVRSGRAWGQHYLNGLRRRWIQRG